MIDPASIRSPIEDLKFNESWLMPPRKWFEVSPALREIRDRELYKLRENNRYHTFESYCQDVWKMTPQRCNSLADLGDTLFAIIGNDPYGLSPDVWKAIRTRILQPLSEITSAPERRFAFWEAFKLADADGCSLSERHIEQAVKAVQNWIMTGREGKPPHLCEDASVSVQTDQDRRESVKS